MSAKGVTKAPAGQGPRLKTTSLKLLESSDGIHDDRTWEPIVKPDLPYSRFAPEKPDYLSPEASKHWDILVPEMARLNILAEHNLAGLVILCESWSRYRECEEIIKVEGQITKNRFGADVKNPALLNLETADSHYRWWANEFGLTPASEPRVKVPASPDPSKEENPFSPGAKAGTK
jgi:P27 family predicted phage terminase small subunit